MTRIFRYHVRRSSVCDRSLGSVHGGCGGPTDWWRLAAGLVRFKMRHMAAGRAEDQPTADPRINHGSTMDQPWINHGSTTNTWINHGSTMDQPWITAQAMDQPRINHGSPRINHGSRPVVLVMWAIMHGCMVRARLHAYPARTHCVPSCGNLPARQWLPVCPAACATLPASPRFSQHERV